MPRNAVFAIHAYSGSREPQVRLHVSHIVSVAVGSVQSHRRTISLQPQRNMAQELTVPVRNWGQIRGVPRRGRPHAPATDVTGPAHQLPCQKNQPEMQLRKDRSAGLIHPIRAGETLAWEALWGGLLERSYVAPCTGQIISNWMLPAALFACNRQPCIKSNPKGTETNTTPPNT